MFSLSWSVELELLLSVPVHLSLEGSQLNKCERLAHKCGSRTICVRWGPGGAAVWSALSYGSLWELSVVKPSTPFSDGKRRSQLSLSKHLEQRLQKHLPWGVVKTLGINLHFFMLLSLWICCWFSWPQLVIQIRMFFLKFSCFGPLLFSMGTNLTSKRTNWEIND